MSGWLLKICFKSSAVCHSWADLPCGAQRSAWELPCKWGALIALWKGTASLTALSPSPVPPAVQLEPVLELTLLFGGTEYKCSTCKWTGQMEGMELLWAEPRPVCIQVSLGRVAGPGCCCCLHGHPAKSVLPSACTEDSGTISFTAALLWLSLPVSQCLGIGSRMEEWLLPPFC